jgi:hypothetical protein
MVKNMNLQETQLNLEVCKLYKSTTVLKLVGMCVFYIAQCVPVLAQANLTGHVTDDEGNNLEDATVIVKELGLGTTTNSLGRFIFKLPSGRWTLRVSFVGHESREEVLMIEEKSKNLNVHIVLKKQAISIGGIEVVAETEGLPLSPETKTRITSGDLDHLQAASIGEALFLVPGVQRTENPSLGRAAQAAIRGDIDDPLSAFGTQIILDGAPVSNNANLQFERLSNSTTGISTVGRGSDLRQIPAANVEEIEVIRGIPSSRYGDMTSGIINVKTKVGKQPHRVIVRNNPDTREANSGAGVEVFKQAVMTYNLNIAQSEREVRFDGDEFTRYTAQVTLSHMLSDSTVSLNHKFLAQGVRDEERPQGDVFKTENYNRGYTLNGTSWGKWNISSATVFNYNAFLNFRRENSMRSRLISGDVRILPNGDTVASYIGRVENFGAEWTAGGRIEMQTRWLFERWIHQPLLGVDVQLNANRGEGVKIDSLFSYYGPEAGRVSYSFDDIPSQTLLSLYAEDRMIGKLIVPLTVVVGLRYELYNPIGRFAARNGAFLHPRVNVSATVLNGTQVRFGIGTASKSPAMSNMFPPPEVLRWRNPITSNTEFFNLPRRAQNLQGYFERQAEVSIDQSFSQLATVSISGFYRERLNEPESQVFPVFSSVNHNGAITVYNIGTFTRAENLGRTLTRGIELSLITRRIKSLNLDLQISGGYTSINSSRRGFVYKANPDASIGQSANYQVTGEPIDTLIGLAYPPSERRSQRALISYFARYLAPHLGLWVTLRLEHLALDQVQTTVTEPVDESRLNESQKAQRDFNARVRRNPQKFLWSLNVSKALWKGGEVSFYINNVLDDPAIYDEVININGDRVQQPRNPPLFYGMQLSFNFDSFWQ